MNFNLNHIYYIWLFTFFGQLISLNVLYNLLCFFSVRKNSHTDVEVSKNPYIKYDRLDVKGLADFI